MKTKGTTKCAEHVKEEGEMWMWRNKCKRENRLKARGKEKNLHGAQFIIFCSQSNLRFFENISLRARQMVLSNI